MTNENSILLNYPHVPFFYHELLEPLKNSIGKCRCNLYLILLILIWNTYLIQSVCPAYIPTIMERNYR